MQLNFQHWDRTEPPTERHLRQVYQQEGLSPYTWSNAPGDYYPAHTHSYNKVLIVVRGSINWVFPELDQEIEAFPGDRINLPGGVLHAAKVGEMGVTCLEAHCE
jgi:quercetin dioxygenase-like cupin family protein